MANQKLAEEIRHKRALKQFSQADVANKLDIPISSYSTKERVGKFSEAELTTIAKMLGLKAESLISLANDKPMSIVDGQKFLIQQAIRNESYNNVILRALAEIAAGQKKGAVAKILADWREEINRESIRQLDVLG